MAGEPLLWMTNVGIPGPEQQTTTQEAFDLVWAAKGWTLVPYDAGISAPIPPPHLTEADRPNLVNRANHTGVDSPATPAPSVEVAYAQITADVTGIVVDTLNLDLITGLAVVVPNMNVPICLESRLNISHSVINANVAGCIALSTATIVTGLKHAAFGNCAAIGSKAGCSPFVRLPPNSPGTYQVFICGDAGTAAVRCQTYYPAFIRAFTS